jgi:hypothetical protein
MFGHFMGYDITQSYQRQTAAVNPRMMKVEQINRDGAIHAAFSKKTGVSGRENYAAYSLCPGSLPSSDWPVLPG